MRVQAQAEPIQLGAGRTGVLLSHGFTGTPSSMRPWARYLADAGLRVSAPRLPGHGTSWQQMNRTSWEDWYAAVERAYLRLRDECDLVVVGGQSMGGALVLRLAAEYGSAISGVVLVNPSLTDRRPVMIALPVARRLLGSVSGIGSDIAKPGAAEHSYDRVPLHALAGLKRLWRTVGRDLPRVRQPLLVFRSAVDHVVAADSVRLLRRRVGSAHVEEEVLPDSYHVATLDYDAPRIFAGTLEFIRKFQPNGDVRPVTNQ